MAQTGVSNYTIPVSRISCSHAWISEMVTIWQSLEDIYAYKFSLYTDGKSEIMITL